LGLNDDDIAACKLTVRPVSRCHAASLQAIQILASHAATLRQTTPERLTDHLAACIAADLADAGSHSAGPLHGDKQLSSLLPLLRRGEQDPAWLQTQRQSLKAVMQKRQDHLTKFKQIQPNSTKLTHDHPPAR
jgi:hypothetical protein